MMLLWLLPARAKPRADPLSRASARSEASPPGRPRLWLGNEMRTSILGVIAAIGAFAFFGVASPAEADVNITGAGLWGENTRIFSFSAPGGLWVFFLTLRIIQFPQIRQTKLPISLMN